MEDFSETFLLSYRDTDREEWITAMVASGVPAEYAEFAARTALAWK